MVQGRLVDDGRAIVCTVLGLELAHIYQGALHQVRLNVLL